ncbi:MAG: GNAT family N-acetyltransferase [Clostridiaceae bacterium]|jgi:predicted GNAT family N-acyltransferase|nr:GNAT family N-acetyltransferase [Clostridiaceae bacterium]
MKYVKLLDINDDIRTIRKIVFIDEQGESYEDEFSDLREDNFVHCCLYDGEKLVAYVRFSIKGEAAHIGRVAVLREYRSTGLGSRILALTEKEIFQSGANVAELNAQMQAQGFYEKQGYVSYGEIFLEVGIPHKEMRKQVNINS